MSAPITVNCPTCQRAVDYVPENEFRPFCSKRCQLIDLGVWADEGYSIPATPTEDDLEEIMNALEEGEGGDSDKPFLYQ